MNQERRADDALIRRIEGLEGGHSSLSNAVALNTKITTDGLNEINAKLGEMTEMFEHYKAAKFGGAFLTKVGGLVIAVGGAWAMIKGYKL